MNVNWNTSFACRILDDSERIVHVSEYGTLALHQSIYLFYATSMIRQGTYEQVRQIRASQNRARKGQNTFGRTCKQSFVQREAIKSTPSNRERSCDPTIPHWELLMPKSRHQRRLLSARRLSFHPHHTRLHDLERCGSNRSPHPWSPSYPSSRPGAV